MEIACCCLQVKDLSRLTVMDTLAGLCWQVAEACYTEEQHITAAQQHANTCLRPCQAFS